MTLASHGRRYHDKRSLTAGDPTARVGKGNSSAKALNLGKEPPPSGPHHLAEKN